ncbi:tripartite tricarboxylate transporter TctB family protein [Halomonas alkalisoli]|uniref:tripartite tricarboxylate transporter TctB family protein n=1 Tax=Halomonas alkalisoli TaxID=2907158 RepID=UPI001F28AC54|nr:tripartite tricarboxylate transporter TctB family protein [Halomonas alkalisoli]MCE9681682.1 tripartite tricarboxylate transporter TctB family protein [Halomonas alkalisoli]
MFSNVSPPSGLCRDLAVAVVVLLFGIGGWIWAQQFPVRAMLWPNIIFIALALLGAGYMGFLLLRLLVFSRGSVTASEKEDKTADEAVRLSGQQLMLLSIAALTTVVYLFVFPVIGFYSATFLFLLVVPLLLGYRNLRWIVGYSTITVLLLWLVFDLLLNRSLPSEFFL